MLVDVRCPNCSHDFSVEQTPDSNWTYTCPNCYSPLELDWDYSDEPHKTWFERRINYSVHLLKL